MDVRGHLCEKLKRFQEFSTYSCIPKFTSKGFTTGCDGINRVPLLYCPFCGEKLASIKLYKVKCNDCGEKLETFEVSDYCEECYNDNIEIEIVEL